MISVGRYNQAKSKDYTFKLSHAKIFLLVSLLFVAVKDQSLLNLIFNFTEITIHPQDQLAARSSIVALTCTSSVSSNVTFSWTRNGTSISGSSTTGYTSILTITRVKHSVAGSYVCTVRSGSLLVMSNPAILTVYGMLYM